MAALLMALVAAVPAGQVLAHTMELFGYVSVDPQGELTVRIVDPYGAKVEGQRVTAYATAPGGRPTRPVELKEGPAGTYRGPVTAPGAERYRVTAEVALAGDLHRLEFEVRAGEGSPEQMLPMVGIDPPQGIPWSRILYIGAAVLLVAATVAALLRKPSPAGGE